MTTHVLVRPNVSLQYTLGMGIAGGLTSFFGSTNDSSDTTYIFARSDGDSIVLGLGTTTISSNQRVKGVTLYIRNARDMSGGGTQDTLSQIVAWPNLTHHVGDFLSQRNTAVIWTFAGPQAATPPGKTTEWLQSDINDLAIYIRFYPSHTGLIKYQRVYEVWADIEIMTQASVSAVTVSTTDQNVTPTISWTYTDPDSTPQQQYETKVFDTATYSATNFDPSTSTPIWTSGVVTSITSTTVVGVPLLNGGTYKAYVRAAKIGPKLPNASPYWWSTWSSSSSFTVVFTPPPTPVLSSPGVITDENQLKVPLIVNAPINLLTYDNSAFETTIGNWTATSGCSVARSTTQAMQGLASMSITVTGSPAVATCGSDLLNQPHVESGTQYTATAAFRAATVTRSCAVIIAWYRLDNTTLISSSTGGSVTDTTTGWTQATVTATAPSGAVYARVQAQITGGSGSEVHYVDEVDIHTGSSTSWSAGGYQNTLGGIQIERCEFVDDARGPAQNWFQLQVGSTGADARNVSLGFFWDVTHSTLNWLWLDTALGRSGYISTGMLRWIIQDAVASQSVAIGRDFYGRSIYNPPALAGNAHTFSVWAWVKTGTRHVHPGIQFYSGVNAFISTAAGSSYTLSTTPQLLQVTATAPANTMWANGLIVDEDGTASQAIYLSTAGFGLGTAPVDGYQPQGVFPQWQPIQFIGTSQNTLDGYSLQFGYGTSQIETIPDFEYPPARPVMYRAYIAYLAQSNYVLRSSYSNTLQVYGNTPTRTIIRSVVDNTIGCVVNRRQTLTSTISQDAQIFHPAGADRAPVQVRDWVSGEDGTIELIVANEAQMQRIRRLIDANTVLVIQWAQGGRSYVTLTGVVLTETISTDRTYCDIDGQSNHLRYVIVSLSYLETVSPSASYPASI